MTTHDGQGMLKACPFCGCDDVETDCYSRDDKGVCLEPAMNCNGCGAIVIFDFKTEEPWREIRERWDTRTAQPSSGGRSVPITVSGPTPINGSVNYGPIPQPSVATEGEVERLLRDWQTDRSEWHSSTTLEVVREYAEWREARAAIAAQVTK